MESTIVPDRRISSRAPLERLFRPRGVAIVGASRRAGSLGARAVEYGLRRSGGVQVYLVNPETDTIAGARCYPSIRELPHGPIDVAFLMVPSAKASDEVLECGRRGIPFVIVGSSGFAEGGGAGSQLEERLALAARAANVRLIGPNTNGLWNAIDAISIGFNVSHGIDLRPGTIGIAAQSGAMLGSLIKKLHDLGGGISYAVASGNEADLELADYIAFLAADRDTTSVLVLVDALREPRRFADAVLAATAGGKSAFALKLGTSERGIEAAHLHSSRLAGHPEAFGAFLRKLGVVQVPDIETLAAAGYLAAHPGLRVGDRLGCVSTSGGGAALLADHAERYGFMLPPFSATTRGRLASQLRFTSPHNPLDLTGQSFDPAWVTSVFESLLSDEDVDSLVYLITLLYPDDARATEVARLASRSTKAVVAYAPGRLDATLESMLADGGVLLAHSANEAFGSLRAVTDARDARPSAHPDWTRFLPRRGQLRPPEHARVVVHDQARALVEAIAMSFPAEAVATTPAEATARADAVGYPVALKVLDESLPHKTRAGGVLLDLSAADVAAASCQLLTRFPRSRLLIQRMVRGQIELYLGYRWDQQAGPVVILGIGGSDVEDERDLTFSTAPVTEHEVYAALRRLRAWRQLARRVERWEEVVALVVRFGDFAARSTDWLESVEINPLVVTGTGAPLALDVRVLTNTIAGGGT